MTSLSREERAARYSDRVPPVIRGTSRGLRLRVNRQERISDGLNTNQIEDAELLGVDRSTTTISAVRDAVPPILLGPNGTMTFEGDFEMGQSVILEFPGAVTAQIETPIEQQAQQPQDRDMDSLTGTLPEETDEGLHSFTASGSQSYFLIVRLVSGTHRPQWGGNLIMPDQQSPSIAEVLNGLANQWGNRVTFLENLAQAYDSTTSIFCSERWSHFNEGDIGRMVPYGLLHERSSEPCRIMHPSAELLEVCRAYGRNSASACIGLYLWVLPVNGGVDATYIQEENLIRQIDEVSYRWLRYWKSHELTGEYGGGYRKYRIILLALKLRHHLRFDTMNPQATRKVPRTDGREITLLQLWTMVQQVSGITCSFKTFRDDASIVTVGFEAKDRLAGEMERRILTHAEQKRYKILGLMLQDEAVLELSALSESSSESFETLVNQMSARTFATYVRN